MLRPRDARNAPAARHGYPKQTAALIRTVIAQPDYDHAGAQLNDIAASSNLPHPTTRRVGDVADDLLASAEFPPVKLPKIWSKNPIERLNRELKRLTNVGGIDPNAESETSPVGSLLVQIDVAITASDRRCVATRPPEPSQAPRTTSR